MSADISNEIAYFWTNRPFIVLDQALDFFINIDSMDVFIIVFGNPR